MVIETGLRIRDLGLVRRDSFHRRASLRSLSIAIAAESFAPHQSSSVSLSPFLLYSLVSIVHLIAAFLSSLCGRERTFVETRRGGGDSEFTEMGKSIRSKRLKRLRTLKRELVTPHYDEKEALKNTVMEAALAAPKVVIPKKRSRDEAMEVEEPARGRPGQTSTSMAVDDAVASTSGNDSKLKARGGIKKRGKSQGRLKKERHHKKKLNF